MTVMRRNFFLFSALLLLLSACSDYSLTVNEQVVYTPPRIFTDFRLQDLELQRCVDQSIVEGGITAAKQLERLQCPGKAIVSVEGLELFSELKVLGLEHNALTDITSLGQLTKLEQLNLADNALVDVSALQTLNKLHYLNLSENAELDCNGLSGIVLLKEGKFLRPNHCQ